MCVIYYICLILNYANNIYSSFILYVCVLGKTQIVMMPCKSPTIKQKAGQANHFIHAVISTIINIMLKCNKDKLQYNRDYCNSWWLLWLPGFGVALLNIQDFFMMCIWKLYDGIAF